MPVTRSAKLFGQRDKDGLRGVGFFPVLTRMHQEPGAKFSAMFSLVTIDGKVFIDIGSGYLVYVEDARTFNQRTPEDQAERLRQAGVMISDSPSKLVH